MKNIIYACARASLFSTIAILMLLGLIVSPAAARSNESDAGALQGTINVIGTDGYTHNAAHARVRLINGLRNDLLLAVADDSGRYDFERLAPGRYAIAVTAGGFENIARLVTITAGETTIENITIEGRSLSGAYETFVSEKFASRFETNEASPSYQFKISPQVFDESKLFKPRDLPGDLTAMKFGARTKSIGKMYGLSFAIEMK